MGALDENGHIGGFLVLLAMDLLQLSDYLKLLRKNTKLAIDASDDSESSLQFKFIFDLIFSIAKTIDEQCGLLKEEPDYQKKIESIINSKLNSPFSRLSNFRTSQLALIDGSEQTDPSSPIQTINSNDPLDLDYFSLTSEVLNMTVRELPSMKKSVILSTIIFSTTK
ncbi:hypothetical protein V8V91_17220 [Algoriphagus halophilus]|uniref:hypothetical protein n=1 Tax=Algoriphagus halophilus TaxID=226505 RepID=UPI00358FFB73